MTEGGDCIICLVLLLTVACYFDYRKAKIPNWLAAAGLVLAVGTVFLKVLFSACGAVEILWMFLRVCVTVLVMYPLFKIGVLGAGDVKIFAVCSAYLEGRDCVTVYVLSLLLAAVAGLCKLLFLGNFRERIGYLLSYAMDVAQFGVWKPYWTEENLCQRKQASLRMAGPLLTGVLLHLCYAGLLF